MGRQGGRRPLGALMAQHKPIGLYEHLGPPLALLEAMQCDLYTTASYLVPPLVQASEALKDAILRDERGPPPPPEYTQEAINWEPPQMPSYTAAAIEGELVALKGTPPANAKGQLANTAYQIGRWAGAGYLPSRDGKRTIWKVAKSTGAIEALGAVNAENIISTNFERGQSKPRTAPQKGQ